MIIVTRTATIPIEQEVGRREVRLVRRGSERCGPCPVCGGQDRFSINIKKQVWNCRGCRKGGDVIDLVRHLEGVGYKEACHRLGCDDVRPPIIKPKPLPLKAADGNSDLALRIWKETSSGGALLKRYFERRHLAELLPLDDVIRFHPSCPFDGTRHPCIIALCCDIVTNRPRAIYRTALTPDGAKIDRLSLGPTKGTAIKLVGDADIAQGLTIGEGLETTLAGMLLGFTPAWATGSAGGIESFPALPGIETLNILVDHDENQRGQNAALACSAVWTAAGREVLRIIPRRVGADMADLIEAAS
jgi:hypothetical protein